MPTYVIRGQKVDGVSAADAMDKVMRMQGQAAGSARTLPATVAASPPAGARVITSFDKVVRMPSQAVASVRPALAIAVASPEVRRAFSGQIPVAPAQLSPYGGAPRAGRPAELPRQPEIRVAAAANGYVAAKEPSTGNGVGALPAAAPPAEPPATVDFDTPLSIVLFGATGDLARKKLYPAMYQLMFGAPDAPKIPQHSFVVGYGRSEVDLAKHLDKQCVNVKGDKKQIFFKQCSFVGGAYDKEESFAKLDAHLKKLEGGGKANRIFFFSVPPTLFADVAKNIKAQACAPAGGFTRLILEKPFGKDSASFADLNQITSSLFNERDLFRIDHYLGKEVVLNLVAMRFGNQIYEGIWNRNAIESVQVVFKENLGTGGRGGYFDGFGIIRDIMQNHLLQVLLWFAMEPPSSLTGDAIQREKCRLLRAIRTLSMDDCYLGQFTGNEWDDHGVHHKEPGYLEDPTVPEGSRCPTYAAVVLSIDNERWRGVPFMMRAGKGLDERLAEIRVTFKKKDFNNLVPGPANELVMRIQPDESLYFKYMNKLPGWEQDVTAPIVMDKSLGKAFPGTYVADAYERMFLNTAKGDRSLFVGSDELVDAWRIFTPLLHEIDKKRPQPVLYPFGVRVPPGMDAFAEKYGISMAPNFDERLHQMGVLGKLETFFFSQCEDCHVHGAKITANSLKTFARDAFDGLEPTDAQMKEIMLKLHFNSDGTLDIDELKAAACHFGHMVHHDDNQDHS